MNDITPMIFGAASKNSFIRMRHRECACHELIQAHKVRVQYKKPTSAEFASFADGWGRVKSLEHMGDGPAGLVHAQNSQFFLKQKVHLVRRHLLPAGGLLCAIALPRFSWRQSIAEFESGERLVWYS
jgi:hypothetical protein